MCQRRTERKRQRLVVSYIEERMWIFFLEYGMPLTAVPSFRYSGCILLSTDKDWPLVEHNLRWAQGKWGRVVNILGKEGENKSMAGKFYVAVVQSVRLFGLEMWVVTS